MQKTAHKANTLDFKKDYGDTRIHGKRNTIENLWFFMQPLDRKHFSEICFLSTQPEIMQYCSSPER